MSYNLEQFVRQAKNGDKSALETVVRRIQGRVFGLAMRMLDDPGDAEDEAQEILIKIITHLSDFREESAFTSWVYRIACNHLLSSRKRIGRRPDTSFEFLEELISTEMDGPFAATSSGPERDMLREEVRLNCMRGILSCLDKEIRIAFILGDVFEVSSKEGGYILDITPEAFRKRLSRGREQVHGFMLKNCGLVKENNPCSCDKHIAKVASLLKSASDHQGKKKTHRVNKREAMARMKELSDIERVTTLFQSYPENRSPDAFSNILKGLINSGEYRIFMD